MGEAHTTFWDILKYMVIAYGVVHIITSVLIARTVKNAYRGPREMNSFGTHLGKALFKNQTFLYAFIVTGILLALYAAFYGI